MLRHMKVVTIHLDEPVYREFQRLARRAKCSTSELIREAMDSYSRTLSKKRNSLREAAPAASVGAILEPWSGRGDLLSDFFDRP